MKFPVPIIGLIIGAVILLFGRKLFWLFVAAVGFAAGVEFAPHLIHGPSPLLALTFALVLGFVGALLAIFLQKIAIAVAGFLAGGKLAVAIAASFFRSICTLRRHHVCDRWNYWRAALLVLFDWALIILSSVVGAHLIQSAMVLRNPDQHSICRPRAIRRDRASGVECGGVAQLKTPNE